jgi:hypothetical protein
MARPFLSVNHDATSPEGFVQSVKLGGASARDLDKLEGGFPAVAQLVKQTMGLAEV